MNAKALEAQLKSLLNISPPNSQKQPQNQQQQFFQLQNPLPFQQQVLPGHSQLLHDLPHPQQLQQQSNLHSNVDHRLIDPRMAMLPNSERDAFLDMRMRAESEDMPSPGFQGA